MVTEAFIVTLLVALVIGVAAISVLVCGIHAVLTDEDVEVRVGLAAGFLLLSSVSAIGIAAAYTEYQEAKPQNQVKILRQKVYDAEKDLQKYLIDHPELE